MARGSKKSYSPKQKRKANHIEESYEKRGVSKGEAAERAWRTVNKQDHGAKKKSSASKPTKSKGTRSKAKTSRTPRKKSSSKR